MKDYSRKHWTDYQYRDWMRTTPSKSLWNSILVQKVGLGEFSVNKSRKSSLSSAIANYLKQSARKKPYRNSDFIQMEDDWEGPPGGFDWNPSELTTPNFDQPWNMGYGAYLTIFDLEGDGCWCDGETLEFAVQGTHPIYGLGISLHEPGTGIEDIEGLGTNEVTGKIFASGDNERGDVNFTASMTSFEGISGSSNWLMSECRTCNECEGIDPMTPGSNPETIAQSGSETILIIDGLGPYDWSVSGTGFTLDVAETAIGDRSNTLNASAIACGTAIITVIDSCETEIQIEVRCLGDSAWVQKTTTCVSPGAATEGDGETKIAGGIKQWQDYHASGGSGCFNFSVYGVACDNPCSASWGPITECIVFDCPELTGDPASYKASAAGCCNKPCVTFGQPGTICALYSGSEGLKYWEWECI